MKTITTTTTICKTITITTPLTTKITTRKTPTRVPVILFNNSSNNSKCFKTYKNFATVVLTDPTTLL